MKLRQFAIALGLTVAAIACAESLARAYLGDRGFRIAESPTLTKTIQTLANATVTGREIDNRLTVLNIAKLSRHPHPETVTTAFLGTSRTKLLMPELAGWQNAVISAGNSYNEISYSYLIEAAFLKQQFPNLKYVFVETSLLNRQEPPPTFIVTPDHRKYLPFLVALQADLAQTPSAKGIATLLDQQEKQAQKEQAQKEQAQKEQAQKEQAQPWQGRLNSELFNQRDRFKISTLLGLNERQQTTLVTETELYKEINEKGEQSHGPLVAGPSNAAARLSSPKIQADDPKITRLVNIKSHYPWDEQFPALADWAKVKGITLVFFQPPVRSDFYAFQEQYGLEMHRQAIAQLAQDRGIPFIDLNARSLHYLDDWSLFSDADHMGSCKGLYIYPSALQLGFKRWQSQGELLPAVTRQEAVKATNNLKPACPLAD